MRESQSLEHADMRPTHQPNHCTHQKPCICSKVYRTPSRASLTALTVSGSKASMVSSGGRVGLCDWSPLRLGLEGWMCSGLISFQREGVTHKPSLYGKLATPSVLARLYSPRHDPTELGPWAFRFSQKQAATSQVHSCRRAGKDMHSHSCGISNVLGNRRNAS